MKERPILFSGAMVRAILEGRKTQTRRVVTPQPGLGDGGCWFPEPPRGPAHRARDYANEAHLRTGLALDFCPYGQPGGRLWVRETWTLEDCGDDGQRIIWAADRAAAWVEAPRSLGDIYYLPSDHHPRRPFKPSIHMPRWASRLTLEVTDVRVQRIQEISEEDARAEGVERAGGFMATSGCWKNYGSDGPSQDTARASFRTLWNSINGERPGCSWEANPWVWCVSFRRVQ